MRWMCCLGVLLAAAVAVAATGREESEWIWQFTIPEGTTAEVLSPGATEAKTYLPGDHMIELVAMPH